MAQPGEGGALSGQPGALFGLRVLNLGSTLAAAWCARTLADYGADTTIVEPPGGAALRSLGPHSPEGESIPAAYALANQHSMVLDLAIEAGRDALRRLAADSDVVLESHAPGVLEDAGASFEELRNERPGLILAALTAHGLTGPRAGQPGNDLTAFARSGWAAINGRAEPPLKGARYVASLYAGLTGAAAVLAALRERAASGRGQLVDLAETDALATTFASVASHAQYQGELEQRNVVWFRDPLQGPLPAADGYFHLMLGRSDFFRLALHILELPELAEDARFESRAARLDLADEWAPAVWERVAAREKLELFEALTTARVAAGPVLDAAELATNEHLEERGFFVRPEGGGPRMPGPAARLSATPTRLRRAAPAPGADGASAPSEERTRDAPSPPRTAEARSRPLEGLRALALTQVWAGAHCAQQLALLGAEVIKIEARRRPDTWRGGYEMRILSALQERPTARRGWNCHPSFNSGNLNQLGVTLDLQRPEGIRLLRRLLRSTDIVVENFTPRVLGSLGIGYEALREERPDVILCSISGFGASGPYRDRPSNGGTIEPASGMSSLLGFPGGPPRNSGATFPDPLAAMTATTAILAALEHRRRTGEGQHIDVSMQEATLALVGDAALEHELTGRTPGPQGNRHPDHAPHGVYPASGEDHWIALAAEDDAQWWRLCEVAGRRDWMSDPRYASNAARKANEDALDAAIAGWTRTQPRADLAARLAAAGLPAAPVLNPGELPADPSFRERGVVAELDHPEAGVWPYVVVPYRLTETPLRVTAPAPCLGEHSAEVLARLAGVDAASYEELVRLGISGEDPPE